MADEVERFVGEIIFVELHLVDGINVVEDMRQAQRLAVDDGGRVSDRANLGEVEEKAGVEFLLVRLEKLGDPLAGDFPATIDDDRVGEVDARAVPFLDGLVLHREGAVDDGDDPRDAPHGVRHHRPDGAVERLHLIDHVQGAVGHQNGGVFVARCGQDGLSALEFPLVGSDAAFARFAEDADLAAFGPGVLSQLAHRVGSAGAGGAEDDDDRGHALRPQRPKGAFCPRSRIQ